MIVEMHCHTSEHSACSHVSAVDLVSKACQVGIQTIVITDHHYQWDETELDDLRKKAGLPEIFKIFSGQEVNTRDFGDILLYGAKETYVKQKISLEKIREQNPDAAIIWAHPYRNKNIPDPGQLLSPLIDGVEIFSSNYTILEASRALRDWHKHKFTAIGGTDTHAHSYTGSYPTIFQHPVQSPDDLVTEIKAGRCRPFSKEIQRAGTTNTKVTEVTIGPKNAEKRKKLIIKDFDDINSWKSGERSFHIAKNLLEHGFEKGTYRIPKPLDKDTRNLSFIEERIDGLTLFDALATAEPANATKYLKMAAEWLSKLHNLKLKLSPANEYMQIEPDRIEDYLKSLVETGNKHLQRAREIKDMVLKKETELFKKHPEILVQSHGDYHPKNIFINHMDHEEFVAVIDFDSSYQLPRAFDVGTFLAQYLNMFFHDRNVKRIASSDIFLETYTATADNLERDFMNQVYLYKSRASLSILYYLAKVGKGESENFFGYWLRQKKIWLISYEITMRMEFILNSMIKSHANCHKKTKKREAVSCSDSLS